MRARQPTGPNAPTAAAVIGCAKELFWNLADEECMVRNAFGSHCTRAPPVLLCDTGPCASACAQGYRAARADFAQPTGTALTEIGNAKVSACGAYKRYTNCRDVGMVVETFVRKCHRDGHVGGVLKYSDGFRIVIHR